MKRKVIQIANSTQLVSLPRKWAMKHNVKKGDEIDVLEEGDKIIVSANKNITIGKTTLKIEDHTKFLRRTLDILYRLGYDEVEIEYNDAETFEKIQKSVEELLGFEVVKHTEKNCTVKNIASGEAMEFENVLSRVFLMTIEMAKNGLDALKEKDYDNLRKYAKFDITVNRFTNFCERLLNKNGYKIYNKTCFVYYIVCSLEQISDELRDLFEYIGKKKLSKVDNEFINMYSGVVDLLRFFYYDVFYKNDVRNLIILKEKQDNIEKNITDRLGDKKCEMGIELHNLLSIIRFIQHMSIRKL